MNDDPVQNNPNKYHCNLIIVLILSHVHKTYCVVVRHNADITWKFIQKFIF